MMIRVCLALFVLSLAACGPSVPEIADRISDEARAQDYPQLQPLDALLASAEGARPRDAEVEGASLEDRAAALRRRAAWLRSLQL